MIIVILALMFSGVIGMQMKKTYETQKQREHEKIVAFVKEHVTEEYARKRLTAGESALPDSAIENITLKYEEVGALNKIGSLQIERYINNKERLSFTLSIQYRNDKFGGERGKIEDSMTLRKELWKYADSLKGKK